MKTRWEAIVEGSIHIPVNETLSFRRLDTDDPQEAVRLSWQIASDYCNSAGNVQGGMLAAFADAVLGAAAATHLPVEQYPALAEMKLSIFRPASAGTTVTGTGRVLKAGKRVLFVEAEIHDDQGRLIAKASGTEIPAEI